MYGVWLSVSRQICRASVDASSPRTQTRERVDGPLVLTTTQIGGDRWVGCVGLTCLRNETMVPGPPAVENVVQLPGRTGCFWHNFCSAKLSVDPCVVAWCDVRLWFGLFCRNDTWEVWNPLPSFLQLSWVVRETGNSVGRRQSTEDIQHSTMRTSTRYACYSDVCVHIPHRV